MLRTYVDFNSRDTAGRFLIPTHHYPEIVALLRPGEQVTGYDEILQVSGIVERDEQEGTWWLRPDWSTRLDLPYPLQIRADLGSAQQHAIGRVLIDPSLNSDLASYLSPFSLAECLESGQPVILYDDQRDIEAVIESRDERGAWWATPTWATERPRPYPFRLAVAGASVPRPDRVPVDADIDEPLRRSLTPGLLIVMTFAGFEELEYDGFAEFDDATRRWWVRVDMVHPRFDPRK